MEPKLTLYNCAIEWFSHAPQGLGHHLLLTPEHSLTTELNPSPQTLVTAHHPSPDLQSLTHLLCLRLYLLWMLHTNRI